MNPIDLTQVLLWQYNDAEKLQALIQRQQDWIEANHNRFWTDWYRDIFDLRTANDFGLSVWAIILGVSFAVEQSDGTKPIFGYDPYCMNYFDGYYSATAVGAVQLSAEQKRTILQLRYFQMTSRATIPEINRAVRAILGDAWILDPMDMTVIYVVFAGTPTSEQQYVLDFYDVIPRPSTIKLAYRFNTANSFGYAPYGMNYFNGVYGV